MTLTAEEVRKAAKEGVEQALANFGWYNDEAQEIRKDITFLRITRRRCSSIKNKIVITIAGLLTTVGMGALGAGIITLLKGHSNG